MQVRRVVAGLAAVAMVAGGVSLAAAPGASAVSVPVGAPASVVAGDVTPEAKVPVSVTAKDGGRVLVVRVHWNDGLDDRIKRNWFMVRVMAGTQELVQRTWFDSRPDDQVITVRLKPEGAKAFAKGRKAGDAVVAVSRQSSASADTDLLFTRNYVTVVRVPPADGRPFAGHGGTWRNCSAITLRPRADLSDCDLAGADLGQSLTGADLSDTVLAGANLINANLFAANLSDSNLSESNLTGANLSESNLTGANLSRSNLTGASLSGAGLSGTDLRGANLTDADINTDLTGTNLSGANLTGANLLGAVCGNTIWTDGTRVPGPTCPATETVG